MFVAVKSNSCKPVIWLLGIWPWYNLSIGADLPMTFWGVHDDDDEHDDDADGDDDDDENRGTKLSADCMNQHALSWTLWARK